MPEPEPFVGPPAPAPAVHPEIARVRDPGLDRASRTGAAARVLSSGEPEPLRALGELLRDAGTSANTRASILEAIARSDAPPRDYFEPIAALAAAASDEELPPILHAIAPFRTRDAARLLLNATSAMRPWPVREAAFAALARLSGRDDLGIDRARWQDWFDEIALEPEVEWRKRLAVNHARRADRLAAQLETTRQMFAPVYRRLYSAIPPAGRPELLTELLKHDDEDLRGLGFTLARLELSSGVSLPPIVAEAAISLLRHAQPRTRAQAAQLVDQLAPPNAADAVVGALNAETDPHAAAALLGAATRWPSPIARASILRWLEHGGVSRGPAEHAALALFRAGLLRNEQDREAARAALRNEPVERLTPVALRLMVALGEDEDIARVTELLSAPGAATRRAAAEALTENAACVDPVLEAAQRDAALFDVAAAALAIHRPTVAAYLVLKAMEAPSEEVRRAGLLRLSRAMPLSGLVEVAETTRDPAFRQVLLERAVAGGPPAEAADPASTAEAILLLARARLELGQPDRALLTLDAIDQVRDAPASAVRSATGLRAAAYIVLDRTERAEALAAPAEAWILGLRHAANQPHAARVLYQIWDRFGSELTREQEEELAAIAEQITEHGPPEPEPAGRTWRPPR